MTIYGNNSLNITLDKSDVDAVAWALRDVKNGARTAVMRAINRSLNGVKTDMVKTVRKTHNYKASALRKRIRVTKANKANLSGTTSSTGKTVHLTDVAGTSQTKKGVKVNVKKSTGRQLIPRSFLATSGSKKMVLRRPSKRSYGSYDDLYGRYGPAGSGGTLGKRGGSARLMWFPAPHPEHVYAEPETWEKIEDGAGERLEKELAHQVQHILNKHKGLV